MQRGVFLILLIVQVTSCIEPYQFELEQEVTYLVVDARVSNVSFNETLNYPSEGRLFIVSLGFSNKPSNVRDKTLTGANVFIEDDQGGKMIYDEMGDGEYVILDPDFKIMEGRSYRLTIEDGQDIYHSRWEELPDKTEPMKSVYFEEDQMKVLVYKAGEPELETVEAVSIYVDVPSNGIDTRYYMWDYDAHWVYRAPLASRQGSIICWVNEPLYLRDYTLKLDKNGGYPQKLFQVQTIRNERVYEELTVLVKQYLLNKGYFFYLKDLQLLASREGLFEEPPYNPQSNIYHESDSEKKVLGYFGVVREQAQRWYLTDNDLSYFVPSTTLEDCTAHEQEPSPQCYDCMEYSRGEPVNEKPFWW
ncbi:DUF4249 domain-containing protein [Marinoscillum sp. MHG1-6]|uniref:DUF4249 domain-containing protein n=1 Tax=Marinoscillum sp. MHG1-6 TaxID=2959627 RepID=UPI0021571A63|nr:DUF4249 domain-containing protein [Marinoscillum sp. MHG1-6]